MHCMNCDGLLTTRIEVDEEKGIEYTVIVHDEDEGCLTPMPEPAPHWANDCGNARWTSDATGISTSY